MRILYTLILLFLLSPTFASKSPIVNIEIISDNIDLIRNKTFYLRLKIIKENGKIKYTTRTYYTWNRVSVTSNQGAIYNVNKFLINRKNLIKNNNVLELYIQVQNGNQLFLDTCILRIPKIKNVQFMFDSISAYKSYPLELAVTLDNNQVFHLSKYSKIAGLPIKGFHINSDNFIHTKASFMYMPRDTLRHTSVKIRMINSSHSFDSIYELKLRSHNDINILLNGNNGTQGEDGNNGSSGCKGDDGGNGENGSDGLAGQRGENVEIIVRNLGSDKIEFIILGFDHNRSYFANYNSKIILKLSGGNGGNGGDGGSGGSGGGRDEDGNCGSSGSDGSDGDGGKGGDGGNIIIKTDIDIKHSAYIFTIANNGGNGGRGYIPGKKGNKGSIVLKIVSKGEITEAFNLSQ